MTAPNGGLFLPVAFMPIWEYINVMKKIFIVGSIAAGLILQGFFAAPALAQNYSGYAYPSSYFPQYQYPNYQYQNPYNYPYYNYPPSITGVSGPTQLTVGQTGTWTLQVGNNYPYGYTYNYANYGGYLSYSVSWGDENINPYASAYNSGAVNTGTLSHTYIRPGTYTIRFTVTNQWGQSASASETVYVSQGCGYQYGYQYGYNPYGYQNCSYYPYTY